MLISGFRILVSAFLISCFWFPASGNAACFNPSGNAGDLRYNDGFQTEQYCDGGAWVSMGGKVGDTGTGLVGWWKLDEGSGTTAADSSGSGDDGTLNGTTLPVWTAGAMNNGALTFDGVDDYVSFSSVPTISGAFTVSLWVYFNVALGGTQFLWARNVGGSTEIAPLTNHSFYFRDDSGASIIYPSITGIIPTNTWVLLTFRRDDTNDVRVFVNGVDRTDATYTKAGSFTFSRIARRGDGYGALNGLIDDARIYNRALTAADVYTLYTSTGGTSGDITTGLVGYWKLDEGSGTSAADSSGSGYVGTLTNGPVWTTSGMIGDAVTFDGVDDYIQTGSDLIDQNTVTMCSWINPVSTASTPHILASNATRFFIANPPVWAVTSDGWTTVAKSTASALTGVWQHVCAVRKSDGKATLYVNGVISGAADQDSGTPISGTNMRIGSNPVAGFYYFNGSIDDVRIYNRALSPADVLTLYNTTAPGGCAGPLGYVGDLMYSGGSYHVPQYCNGTNWIAMGKIPGAGGSGCSNPAGSEGDLEYNGDYHVMQYCDGATWRSMGRETIGDVLPDGTVYAGLSPDGNVPMYTTRCDAGEYWNGSSCTRCASGQWSGTSSTCSTTWGSNSYGMSWNNATTNWTVTGFTSTASGEANTAGLAALADAGSPYNAASYCKNLSAYGHADWYLPAKDELNVLSTNRVAIANFDTTDGGSQIGGAYPGHYWTSTEDANTRAWAQRLSDGLQFNSGSKINLFAVRCVRR